LICTADEQLIETKHSSVLAQIFKQALNIDPNKSMDGIFSNV
jgi:hypothetical protein